MSYRRIISFLGIAAVLAASCGPGDSAGSGDSAVSGDEQAETSSTTGTIVPAATEPSAVATNDPDRFDDFPSEPNDDWLVGTDYEATLFLDLESGQAFEGVEVSIYFSGRSQISVSASGCGVGGGGFTLVDGRITDPDMGLDAMACTPSDTEVHEAVLALMETEPEIRADGNRLLLLTTDYRLEMEATGPGIVPLIEDNERFIGVETTIAGLDPTRIELGSPAHFVVKVNVPTCEFYGGATEEDQATFQMEPYLDTGQCEYSPAPDLAAQAFFAEGVTLRRAGQTLEVFNSQGTLRFRIATGDDPPMTLETPAPPERIVPDRPDRSLPANAGKVSAPWFTHRAGSTASGEADVPIPEGWEANDPTQPIIAVTGRGGLEVYDLPAELLPWDAEDHHDLLDLMDGPTPVTVKLYRQEGEQVVESGGTATVQQYRYGSDDPHTWLRQVVWILERDGRTTLALVVFPEFPEDSSFADPEDSINLSLTGLDPVHLLEDIRFFE